MPKVVHFTNVHQRNDPRIFLKQCTSLAANGFDTILIVADGLGKDIVNNVTIIDVGKTKSRMVRMLKTSYNVYKQALKQKADIYQFHDPEMIPWALLLKIRGKKIVYDVHEENAAHMLQKHYLPKPIRYLAFIFMKWMDKIAHYAFHTLIAEKYYIKHFPKALEILNYPTDLTQIDVERSFDKPKLLYTGNITEYRGAYIIAQMVKEIPDIEILCIGYCQTEVAEKMRKIAGSEAYRLNIIGEGAYIPFAQIIEQYKKVDWLAGIAIFPVDEHHYKKELTKFFEYMAAGLPVLCSDFPTWKNLIENNNVGLTVDPKDTIDIKAKILYLLQHKEACKQMVENGKRLAREQFNWGVEEKKLLLLYQSILNKK